MASINLVTGYTGTAHVKSEEDALLNRFLLGQNNAVISDDWSYNLTTRHFDINCDAVVNGRLVRTDGNITLEFTMPSSGYYRYDGIYIVYKKLTTGVESAELVYCEGTKNTTKATAESNIGTPTIGADVASYSTMQLFRVEWNTSQTPTAYEIYLPLPATETLHLTGIDGGFDFLAKTIPIAAGVKLYIINKAETYFLNWDSGNSATINAPTGYSFIGGTAQLLVGNGANPLLFLPNKYQITSSAATASVSLDGYTGETPNKFKLDAILIAVSD